MFEKIKVFVVEHKLDLIEKGAIVIGAVIGLAAVVVTMNMRKEEAAYDDVFDVDSAPLP
jgi:hypothetical protein